MSSDLITITSSIVFSGLVSAALTFLFRTWISERLRQSITHEYQLKFESFKQTQEYERKISYLKESTLHEERAQVVKRVYGELVDAMDAAATLVFHFKLLDSHPEFFEHLKVPQDNNPQKWKRYLEETIKESDEVNLARNASAALSKAISAFRKDRLYFESAVAMQIERYFTLMLIVISKFPAVSRRDSHTFEPVVAQKVIETWKASIEASEQLMPQLEKTFRGYFGVSQ